MAGRSRPRLRAAVLGAALLLAPGSASAFFPVATSSSSAVRVHAATVVVAARPDADDVWTPSLQVSGSGRVVVLVPRAELISGEDANAAVDAALYASAPRFVELGPVSPCTASFENYGRVYPANEELPFPYGPQAWTASWPQPERAGRARVEVTSHRLRLLGELKAWLRAEGLELDPSVRPALLGAPFVAIKVWPGEGMTWTPAIRLRRPPEARAELRTVDLEKLAPPGRFQRWDLLTLRAGGGLAVTAPTEDLHAPAPLAEVAFEYPQDTEWAVIRRRVGIEGPKTLIETFASKDHGLGPETLTALGASGASVLRRWVWEGREHEGTFELEVAAPRLPHEPIWLVYRPWRAPMSCPGHLEYKVKVAKHQDQTHRLLSTMTGRPLSAVLALSRDRGYLMEPFGDVYSAALAEDVLSPVEIDRSRW